MTSRPACRRRAERHVRMDACLECPAPRSDHPLSELRTINIGTRFADFTSHFRQMIRCTRSGRTTAPTSGLGFAVVSPRASHAGKLFRKPALQQPTTRAVTGYDGLRTAPRRARLRITPVVVRAGADALTESALERA